MNKTWSYKKILPTNLFIIFKKVVSSYYILIQQLWNSSSKETIGTH